MNIELFGQQLGAGIVKTCDDAIELARNHRIIKGPHQNSRKGLYDAIGAVEKAATEIKKDIEEGELARDPIGTFGKFEDLKHKSLEVERLMDCEKLISDTR